VATPQSNRFSNIARLASHVNSTTTARRSRTASEYSTEPDQDDSATESDYDAATKQSETEKNNAQRTAPEQDDAEHVVSNEDAADESASDQHGQQSLASRAKRFVATRLGSE